MTVIKEITIDILNSGFPPRVYAMQGDSKSRAVKIHLKNNGTEFVVPEGATGIVRYSRSNGNGSSYDTTPDGLACVFGESDVTVYLSQNLLAVSGLVSVSVDIRADSANLHTFAFEISVEKNPGMVQGEDGGFYLAGVVPDSGWEPNKYLGTDMDGKVIAKDPPGGGVVSEEQIAEAVEEYLNANPVTPGATAEQAAQIQANKEAIADIRTEVSSVSITEELQKWTIALSMADGSTETTVLETDANNYPTRLTVNGREILVTVTGV